MAWYRALVRHDRAVNGQEQGDNMDAEGRSHEENDHIDAITVMMP
jgi:hypothetical protein